MFAQSEQNIVASFDRKGEYIYTGNSKGKVSMTSFIMHGFFLIMRTLCCSHKGEGQFWEKVTKDN